jgi:hypothetical protein
MRSLRTRKERYGETLVFFSHKGGVSKTTSAYNIGWMMSKGHRVLLSPVTCFSPPRAPSLFLLASQGRSRRGEGTWYEAWQSTLEVFPIKGEGSTKPEQASA